MSCTSCFLRVIFSLITSKSHLLSCRWLGWASHLHRLQVLDLVRVQLLHLLQLCLQQQCSECRSGWQRPAFITQCSSLTICLLRMQLSTDWRGLALSIMSSMKSTSRLSKSIVPIDSANLVCSSSTSYSRAHISLKLRYSGLPLHHCITMQLSQCKMVS